MAKRSENSDHMQRKSLRCNMDCESDVCEDGERARLWSKPSTPSEAECERHVVSHLPFRDWCRHCVVGRGHERRHQKHSRHDEFLSTCVH